MAFIRRRKNNVNRNNDKKKEKKPAAKKPVRRNPLLRLQDAARGPKAPVQTPSLKKLEMASETFPGEPMPSVGTQEWQPLTELPDRYGDNQIYALVRDPYWIYTYWEIQEDHQQKTLHELGGSWNEVESVLRVYDITEQGGVPSYSDILLQKMARNWYVNVQPNHGYVIEIGLLHHDGRFLVLARSNEVTTPRAGMSDVIDEQWMGIDFDKMYALSGGFEVGKSSMELQKLMEQRLMGAISSGSGVGVISSLASPVKIKKRGFWFVLDCEVIVYGATEPEAKVFFQGREVKLRPDGTFSFRFALPDGKYVFDARAISSDGVEERTITPIIQRKTESPAPVLKSNNNR